MKYGSYMRLHIILSGVGYKNVVIHYLVDWFRTARDTTKSQFCTEKSVLCTIHCVPAGNLNIFIVSVYTHYVKCVLLSIFQDRELTFWDFFTLKMESKCGLL
jgi:hypothetical protein